MSGDNSFHNVINLGNSIIGVSILAMPYCFQKCGIFLSILLIIASGLLTKATCHLLLKSAIKERRRNFEFLAFHTFGTVGKFAVEFGIIGFLLGSCIAFFVVIGDLGPPLFSEFFLIEETPQLRMEVLLFLGFFIALPLGLLRKVESLTSFSTLSVCFYIFLVFKIFSQALPNLSYEKVMYEMNWWKPSGLLSSLPIFAMALSCQTQLFEIFDTLNDPSLKRMDTVVSSAVHMCSSVYSLVGLFGYIAFYDDTISGNVLIKLPGTFFTKMVKLAFVLTIIVSFPLCLFPCRTSLHSLIFKAGVHDMPGNLIPDHRFRLLTFLLVAVTIGTAIMLPNIEFVLGILGSTIGTTICFILPALIFICNTTKNTNERIMAKVVLSIGIFILVACSYSTLHEAAKTVDPLDEPHMTKQPEVLLKPLLDENMNKMSNVNAIPIVEDKILPPDKFLLKVQSPEPLLQVAENKPPVIDERGSEPKVDNEKRQEPPVPQEPDEPLPNHPKINQKKDESAKVKNLPETVKLKSYEKDKIIKAVEQAVLQVPKGEDVIIDKNKSKNIVAQVGSAEDNVLDPDALKKEDKELNAQKKLKAETEKKKLEEEKIKKENEEAASKKQDELLRKIEAQQLEQKKLLEEQRKLLEELKEHKETHRLEEESKKKDDLAVEEAKIKNNAQDTEGGGAVDIQKKVEPKIPAFLPQIDRVKQPLLAPKKQLEDEHVIEADANKPSEDFVKDSGVKPVVRKPEMMEASNKIVNEDQKKSIGSKNGYIRKAKPIQENTELEKDFDKQLGIKKAKTNRNEVDQNPNPVDGNLQQNSNIQTNSKRVALNRDSNIPTERANKWDTLNGDSNIRLDNKRNLLNKDSSLPEPDINKILPDVSELQLISNVSKSLINEVVNMAKVSPNYKNGIRKLLNMDNNNTHSVQKKM